MTNDLQLLTIPDVARLLRISQSKTWALCASGELPSFKINGSRRVAPSALRSYIEHLSSGKAKSSTIVTVDTRQLPGIAASTASPSAAACSDHLTPKVVE